MFPEHAQQSSDFDIIQVAIGVSIHLAGGCIKWLFTVNPRLNTVSNNACAALTTLCDTSEVRDHTLLVTHSVFPVSQRIVGTSCGLPGHFNHITVPWPI